MPDVALVASARQDHAVRELATTLGFELERQGVPARLHLGGFPAARPDRVHILLDPIDYVGLEGAGALPSAAILRRTVFVCVQRPPTGGKTDPGIALLRQAGAVFALDRRDVVVLHRAGIPARLLRPGYSRALDHYDAEAQRPIDIMVLGTRTPRRTEILRRAAPILARHNCLIQLADAGPHPEATSSYLADGRRALLARTKLLLNLHANQDQRLEWTRVLDAIHAGAVVVSEQAAGIAPLDAGAHLLLASPGAIAHGAERLLADPGRLRAIRESAYERLSGWIPYALPVSVLRAAVVELVGEPLGEGDEARGVTVTGPDGAPATVFGEPFVPASPGGSEDGGELPAAAELADSPAWGARRAPRVSVVCDLCEDGPAAVATLDSVAAGRMHDLELVIVHPAGGSGAGTAAAWVAEHPRVPTRRIGLAGTPGTQAALSAAAAVARGAYTLIIEAGSALYPRALEVLAGTLDGTPDAELAYPIQEIVAPAGIAIPADADQLCNVLGWDPGRRSDDVVLTPLLVRTATLRRLLADRSADAGLLARLAERGGRAQLVPQILGRRPVAARPPAGLSGG